MKCLSLLLLVWSLLFGTGYGIQCYTCIYNTTAPDPSCLGPDVSSTHLRRCDSSFTHCGKSETTLTVGGITRTGILRLCTTGTQNACTTDDTTGVTLCTCNTDRCNGVGYTQGSLLVLAACAALAWLFD